MKILILLLFFIGLTPTKDLTDLVMFTYGAEVEYRGDGIASSYSDISEQSNNWTKLPVVVTGPRSMIIRCGQSL